ncbi:hypothetical protein GJ744_005369 [Endocarpon pusillum]|uniref:Heterokaryon incompatibility domain-containing protein n=1 Tax=Endocarpon pusillum TaxID=364733 RepID=A0A8H7E7K2_9EURO|nr:hypothetical protein GJ744_005369 [Endocarpon pusillum]
MNETSPLCAVCAEFLHSWRRRHGFAKTHHNDMKSLTEAVRSRCYICTIVWDCHFTDKKAATASRTDFRRTGWTWQRDEPEEGVVCFSVDISITMADANYVTKQVFFRLVDCEGSKFRRYFLYRNLPPATSSLSSLGVAYSWYLACRAMHKACRRLQRGSNWYPTRLLDVGVPGDVKWKLHICAEDKLISPTYMTISYRWGSLPSLMLVQSNINELRRGKLTDELPQTFRDAIIVLHRFSIRYL